MKIKDFHVALRQAMSDGTGNSFEIGKPPSDNPTMPYGVIHFLPSSQPRSGMGSLQDWVQVKAQIVCVGETHEQAAWLQQAALDTLMDRSPVITDGTEDISWIELTEFGNIVDGGHSLWQSNDVYCFRLNN